VRRTGWRGSICGGRRRGNWVTVKWVFLRGEVRIVNEDEGLTVRNYGIAKTRISKARYGGTRQVDDRENKGNLPGLAVKESDMLDKRFTVLDLFCGAGGMSHGFTHAGFEVLFAADNNPAAVATYERNFSHSAHLLSLDEGVDLPEADVIVGGPPCQGFSSAGARSTTDPRNSLVGVFARIVARHRPKAFIFENVEGFLTGNGGSHVLELLEPLITAGYRIHLRKINAANFGVPQHRKRVIAIGGLGWEPSFPEPTHAAFGAPGAMRYGLELPPTPSVATALLGLETPYNSTTSYPRGHSSKPLEGIALRRAKSLAPGKTMRDLPVELQHDSYKKRAMRRVADGTPTEKRGGAPAGLRRLLPDEPSKAITSGARTEFLHPTEDRNLTLRECARLQTFPDSFDFSGTQSDQALLIGNAVPPLLAFRLAMHLKNDLQKSVDCNLQGALLSCSLTDSEGMSPALQKTAELLSRRTSISEVQENLNFDAFQDTVASTQQGSSGWK